jgi:hypothetical protein
MHLSPPMSMVSRSLSFDFLASLSFVFVYFLSRRSRECGCVDRWRRVAQWAGQLPGLGLERSMVEFCGFVVGEGALKGGLTFLSCCTLVWKGALMVVVVAVLLNRLLHRSIYLGRVVDQFHQGLF